MNNKLIIKKCFVCGEEFAIRNPRTKCCSIACVEQYFSMSILERNPINKIVKPKYTPFWTKEKDEQLRKYKKDKLPLKVMSIRLKCTVNAVSNRIIKLGLQRKYKRRK